MVSKLSNLTLLAHKVDHLHLKDFLKYACELYLKQPLTPL